MLEFARGNFFNTRPRTKSKNAVRVKRPPFFSKAAACFLRRAKSAVISASANWLILGMVVHESVMRRLTVRRSGDIFSRRTGPHLEKSMASVVAAEDGGAIVVAADP